MDELRKKLEENLISNSEWEKIIDRVNPVLDLISNGKIRAEASSRFFLFYESITKHPSESDSYRYSDSHLSFVSGIVTLGVFSDKIIDEAHRTRKEYMAPEHVFYLLEDPSEPYKSIIVDESSRIKKILEDVYKDNTKLITLGSWEFEEMVAELLAKQGFKVKLTKRARDGGYDIIALLDYKTHNPMKFLVECKRQAKNKIGVEVISSFKNVVDSTNVNRGIFVTTSYFTKGSWDEQKKYPYLLDYRDKDQVIEWVKGYFNDIR